MHEHTHVPDVRNLIACTISSNAVYVSSMTLSMASASADTLCIAQGLAKFSTGASSVTVMTDAPAPKTVSRHPLSFYVLSFTSRSEMHFIRRTHGGLLLYGALV